MSRHSARGPAWDAQRLRVLDRDGWLCTACGKALEGADATVDHIEPTAHNPGREYEDHELVAMCRSCNSRKNDSVIRRAAYYNEAWLPNGIAL